MSAALRKFKLLRRFVLDASLNLRWPTNALVPGLEATPDKIYLDVSFCQAPNDVTTSGLNI